MPEIDGIRYRVIRSRRKTTGITVEKDGGVLVRAPLSLPEAKIREILSAHRDWVETHQRKVLLEKEKEKAAGKLTEAEAAELRKKAKKIIPERVAAYAKLVGVTYGKITFRFQKTRWGSCSRAGNLNFNCLLLLAPEEVLDSVIVHELCHRKYMNHGKEFYAEVYRAFPAYKKCHRWLKENGPLLMSRVP